jgi:hypothetical protein
MAHLFNAQSRRTAGICEVGLRHLKSFYIDNKKMPEQAS